MPDKKTAKDEDNERRILANQLKEHLAGPLDDETRRQIEEALEKEKERTRPKTWWQKVGFRWASKS